MSNQRPNVARGGHVVDYFLHRVDSTPKRPAFYVLSQNGAWQPIPWSEVGERAERLAFALASMHVGLGTRVGVCAPSSLEWEIVQTAVWRTGGSVVGLDPNYTDELLARIIDELGIEVLVAANESLLRRLPAPTRERLRLEIFFQKPTEQPPRRRWLTDLYSRALEPGPALAQPDPGNEAVVVFSSGTAGLPKPLPYRHDQLALAVDSILDAFSDIDENSVLVCWLPLANLFQRMINLCAMALGATTYMVEDPRAVMTHLAAASPHVFIGVPRFYDRFHVGVQAKFEGSHLRGVARWAIALGQRRAGLRRTGVEPGTGLKLKWTVADFIVLRRVRAAFGSNLRYCISGSAPMPRWLLEWFDAIGLPVLEAYGTSENIVPIASNTIADRKLGTVGKPLPSQRVTVSDDGEILVRGRGIAGAAPSALKCEENVLATGDLGQIDADGFLTITGRKADVFKSAGGKWIVPSEIEARLTQIHYVEHAVVFGAGREANIALLCVSPAISELQSRQQSANRTSTAGAAATISHLPQDVDAALGDLPSHARLAGLLVLPASAFSMGGGELTTNLKLRRRHVEQKYAAAIDRLYTEIRSGLPRPVIHAMLENLADGTLA